VWLERQHRSAGPFLPLTGLQHPAIDSAGDWAAEQPIGDGTLLAFVPKKQKRQETLRSPASF
jgi:hypothetical protein